MKCYACGYNDDPEEKYLEEPWKIESQFIEIGGTFTRQTSEYGGLVKVHIVACPECSTLKIWD